MVDTENPRNQEWRADQDMLAENGFHEQLLTESDTENNDRQKRLKKPTK